MGQITANGIAIEAESLGPEDGETILLIMGLGAQMTRWPDELVGKLTGRGFRVIRFDNRDVGLSHAFDEHGTPNVAEVIAARRRGETPDVPYTLDDMAKDAVGVLDHFGVTRAHVVGVSMGGMIGQLVAAEFPGRVLSFTSIMSTTGNPDIPMSTKEANAVLTKRAPDPHADKEAFLANAVNTARVIGSPGFPFDEQALRERAWADAMRRFNPPGIGRQMAAVNATGDRRERLKRITAPVVVLHGEEDALVNVAGGRDTAENIPGAELITVPGMGHDMPPALYDTIVGAILKAVERGRAAAG